MRLFFGLEVPADTALAIADWRQRQFPPLGRPVPAANFHITLAFVGECPPQDLERLCEDVDRRLARKPAASGHMRLSQLGYWPKPAICWLGPAEHPATLDTLAAGLQQSAMTVGARRERRRYRPHLTLFRRCDTPPPAPAEPPAFELSWTGFNLYESLQGRQGVHYRAIAGWSLSTGK